MNQMIESATVIANMTSTSSNNQTKSCFDASGETQAVVDTDMLRELKADHPAVLVLYCIVNLSLGSLSCFGNGLVVLTASFFSELRVVSNIGLGNLAVVSFFHGSILHSFLLAIGLSALVDSCPPFQSSRFALFYLSHVFLYNFFLNLCLVTTERFVGVVYSLRYYTIFTKERVVKLFVASWIVSFLLSVPHSVHNSSLQSIGRTTWFLTFGFTLTFSFYCNIKMFRISRRHKRQVKTQEEAVQRMTVDTQRRYRGAQTVFYLLVTLIVCYVPGILINLIKPSMDKDKVKTLDIIRPWTATFHVMYSSISPFVYFFRSRRLRMYSKKLLRKSLFLLRQFFFLG